MLIVGVGPHDGRLRSGCLQDINGVYALVRSGWAIGDHGRSKMWLKNADGVLLKLQARREGLALSLGADGIVIQLGS